MTSLKDVHYFLHLVSNVLVFMFSEKKISPFTVNFHLTVVIMIAIMIIMIAVIIIVSSGLLSSAKH